MNPEEANSSIPLILFQRKNPKMKKKNAIVFQILKATKQMSCREGPFRV
jgi:hypothetical protein